MILSKRESVNNLFININFSKTFSFNFSVLNYFLIEIKYKVILSLY